MFSHFLERGSPRNANLKRQILYHPSRTTLRNMSNHHGEMPITTTTDWHTAESKQDKKKAYQDKVSAFIKKSAQNDHQEPMNEEKSPAVVKRAPLKAGSTFITRINIKVIPQKITTALSVIYNVIRIMTAISAADNFARIIAIDHEGNEIEFFGAKTPPPDNKDTQEFIKQFIEEPRITNRNELVGLITLRSEVALREIKKHPATQQKLNELPRIFLTQNTLSEVTPVLVGFFINHYPRPDKPEAFAGYIESFIKSRDDTTEHQIDFGPIWAKNKKMTVYKLMTTHDNKEALREIMSEHISDINHVQYICASEYYSLNDEDKTKIVATQLEFMNTTRSIFITGIKTVLCNLRLDTMEKDQEDIHAGEDEDLAMYLMNRETGAGETMFTRIHEAFNGLVELYVKPEHHKEAIDWARLATSEIAKELSDRSMSEIFIDVEDANNQLATNPDWKPHTLSQRVEHLNPSELPLRARRRPPVAITYATSNAEKVKEIKKDTKIKSERRQKTSPKDPVTTTPTALSTKQAWTIASTVAKRIPGTDTKKTNEATKLGANKYKIATAAQDQRMDKLEAAVAAIEKVSTMNKDDARITTIEQNIASIAQSQCNTAEAIKQVVQGQGETKAFVRELTEKVKYNKKQADEDHKIMTDAMKLFHDNLVQSQTMINALQRGSESPTRKKRATSQHRSRTNSDHDSDEYSFNSTKMGPLSAVSHPDNFFQSDANMDDMKGAAEEN